MFLLRSNASNSLTLAEKRTDHADLQTYTSPKDGFSVKFLKQWQQINMPNQSVVYGEPMETNKVSTTFEAKIKAGKNLKVHC